MHHMIHMNKNKLMQYNGERKDLVHFRFGAELAQSTGRPKYLQLSSSHFFLSELTN